MNLYALIQEGAHHAAEAGHAAVAAAGEGASQHGGGHGEVSPIVSAINAAIGPATVPIQGAIMGPIYHLFGKEWVAPAHGQEIPAHVIFAIISFLICTVGLKLFMGPLNVASPSRRQQFVEVVVENIRGMLDEVVGPYGRRYMPVVTAFALFILISNLMGLLPLLDAPTGNFNVPLALGIIAFVYYISMGFKQQGLGYLKHFTGGLSGALAPFAVLIFAVEVVSNFLRPATLGVRLFLNMFADHTIGGIVNGLVPGVTQWIFPLLLPVPLATFVAMIQTLVFVMLSMVYLSETVPHEEHDHDEHGEHASHAERQVAHAH